MSVLIVHKDFARDPVGGRQLYDGACETRDFAGHTSLRPIHFVHFAFHDDRAPVETYLYLSRYGLDSDVLAKALHKPVREDVTNQHMSAMTHRLFINLTWRLNAYEENRRAFPGDVGPWHWYTQAIKVAMELVGDEGIDRLLMHSEQRVLV